MRKAPPGGNGKGSGVSKNSTDPYNTPADSPQTAAADWPSFIEVPHIRHMPSSDTSDVLALWWAMRRKGIRLPAQEGIIVLRGWRP